MAKPLRMHVARTPSKYVDKAGDVHRYESVLVRRTYRDGKKVRHETLANLSKLPAEVIAAIEATLKGQALVPAEAACTITRSLPHGHVAAVAAMARRLGFPGLLGPACRSRDLVLGLIISRVIRPASKLSTLSRWADCTLGPDLAVADASTDEVYAAMDWLADRQEAIEKKLAAKHLGPAANPTRMAMFDLTSSWVTGRCCELAAYGYSRDGKKGLAQIEYGVLTDPAGRPVAVRVVPGNTADPVAFSDIVEVIRDRFGLTRLVLVGDRGMITSARITALRELNSNNATAFGWISALRAPDIATLAAEQGPLQMSLFDTHDLAEISHPDYPGERSIACRNPALAAERARNAPTAGRHRRRPGRHRRPGGSRSPARSGQDRRSDRPGHRQTQGGQTLSPRDHRHHLHLPPRPGRHRRRSQPRWHLRATHVGTRHRTRPGRGSGKLQNLAHVERDFRSIKTDDLDLRPIHHHLDERVRAHVLICLLACYLVWHLRQASAPLTFTDEHPPARDTPSPPRNAHHRPKPRPPPNTTPTATRCSRLPTAVVGALAGLTRLTFARRRRRGPPS